jgi:hypothetical protein
VPDASIREQGARSAVTAVGSTQLAVTASRDAQWVKGSRRPLSGWVSPRYGQLAPAAVCRIATTSGSPVVVTLLEPILGASSPPTLDVVGTDSGAIGARITRDNAVEYLLVSRGAPTKRLSLFGIDFEGALLWLRAEGARPVELRTVDGHRAESKQLGFALASRRGPTELHLSLQDAAALEAARQEVELSLART